MKFLASVLFSFLLFPALANDGMFMSSGGNLMPVKETSIEMKKEVLFLKQTDAGFEVSIYFEFFNPGEARDEIVGFVSPPSSEEANYFFDEPGCGDNGKKLSGHPYISGFMVMVNNQLLPWQVERFDSTGFQSEIIGAGGGCDYVYYFNVHFEPGINIIRHSYLFRGSSSLVGQTFYYRLTTGKMWAKDAIGDFELIIDAPDTYMQIPKTFNENGAPISWQVNGIGRLAESSYNGDGNAFLKSGFLRYHAVNFAPDYDIFLSIPNLHLLFYELDRLSPDKGFEVPETILPFLYSGKNMSDSLYNEYVKDFSDEFIQTAINLMYARKGLMINKVESAELFKPALWYLPDPNLKAADIKFTDDEKRIIDALAAERNRRKK